MSNTLMINITGTVPLRRSTIYYLGSRARFVWYHKDSNKSITAVGKGDREESKPSMQEIQVSKGQS